MITDSLFGNAIKREREGAAEKMSGSLLPMEDLTKPVFTVVDLGKMLLISAKEGNTAQVRELMTKGAPFSTDWLGTSPLHLAAMNNHLETCQVLLKAGLNKDARTKVDRTPLHFAVYEGHKHIVELLVSNQCDIDARDMLRMSPLHWAVEKRHKKIVDILLRHGADPNAESKFRKTPISMALENGYNDIYLMLDSAYRERLENPEQLQRATNSIAQELRQTDDVAKIAPAGEMEEIEDTHSPPINSSSIDEDNGMTLSDAIIRLQTIDDARINPSSTLQMLKDHGISMLPTEDTENAFISSALQGGRKIVLSEAGKLMLNESKARRTTSHIAPATSSGQTPRSVNMMSISATSVKPLKSGANKVIKIVTAEEFKRILAGDLSATKKVQLKSNGSVLPAKHRRNMVVSKRPELLPAATDIFAENESSKVKPPQVPNLLDIHAEGPLESDMEPDDYAPDLSVFPAAVAKGHMDSPNTSMGLSEIEKQLLDLKKQTEELRRQLEISQRQNEEYKVRLEKLEQEKEVERRHNLSRSHNS
ncbi:GA-binding protein subunit beta-1 [Phlebotomus argentipes]|uniref:GA-binding protein subunit beta-1 n=1 Tax=Phlebotomus argentipes TaxID=94469 RepID=UPI002892AF34|nr:GA-binding protein subunit beta-1 [Phlebotomus argentipes]